MSCPAAAAVTLLTACPPRLHKTVMQLCHAAFETLH